MKILFISAANNIHTERWVNSLSNRGHEVHLVYNKNHSPQINKFSEKVILHELKYSGSIGYYLNAPMLKKIHKKIKPDIVNAHYASGYGTLARISGVAPLVLSVWGSDVYDFPYESNLKMKILKRNLLYSDTIASTSNCMARQTRRVLEDENINIYVTPFGVDLEKFKNIRTEKDLSKFKFGIVKTLQSKYGIKYLIEAFKLVLEKINENKLDIYAELDIYGSGELESELKKLCRDLKIEDKVLFKGYIHNDEVPKAINSMDVFCLSSILDSESFGVAAVESMACEVPVIATDVDGFKEVVVDGETGYIVKRCNSKDLADKMYNLMCDKKNIKSMGVQGRKRVKELYDWETNVTSMEKVYSDTIEKIR